MHKVRRKAHYTAWEADEFSSYNPFGRQIYRTTTGRAADIESQGELKRGASEANVTLQLETDRHGNGTRFAPPAHASTAPADSPATGESTSGKLFHREEPPTPPSPNQPSAPSTSGFNSRSTTSETPLTNANGGSSRHRKKGFLGLGGISEKDEDSSQEIDKTTSKTSTKNQKFTFWGQLRATLFGSWINVLLVCVPVGIALHFTSVTKIAVFVINFLAIIPLAGLLAYSTEEIAMRVGETLGGLLNASFGNAVELIVSIIALAQNQIIIVKTSLIGSMLSNLLLVMGMCFFFGGLRREQQYFNEVVAQTAASLLALAVGSLIIPTVFRDWTGPGVTKHEANIRKQNTTPLSRGVAVILLVIYGCYLLFQLKTHTKMYNEPSPKAPKRKSSRVEGGMVSKAAAMVGVNASGAGGETSKDEMRNSISDGKDSEEEEHEETPQISIYTAVFTLCLCTAFVGWCAEYMVDSISALTKTGNISEEFVGLILIPIVGNAAEHATAVTVAIKDKMDLAIGVAVGSSLQIALLVLPLSVVLGWILGKDAMNLSFDGFLVALLFVSVLLVNYLISDGRSHWMEGALLQALYIIIAVAAWFYPASGNVVG